MTIFNERIYDAAEERSMPLQKPYLDRCVRENKADKDEFLRFRRIAVFRPTSKLLKALTSKKRSRDDA